jgi:predicted phosphodiesterase
VPRRPPLAAVAILSDIHGNRQALDAVLEDVAGHGITRWWCVGDVVGYGADPDYALEICMSQAERCIAGNHDLGVAGRVPLEEFSSWAYDGVVWTQHALGHERCATLGQLEPTDIDHDVPMVHASVRDPIWEYVVGASEAKASLDLVRAHVTCIGHTHIPAAWHRHERGTVDAVPAQGIVALAPGRWLINPGSVGQPRDNDPRASWMVLDLGADTLEFVRTPYDVGGAQRAIRAAGLPEILAERLAEGF